MTNRAIPLARADQGVTVVMFRSNLPSHRGAGRGCLSRVASEDMLWGWLASASDVDTISDALAEGKSRR